MEDREFLDELYSQWAKTTGAEDKFWMPEECYEGGMNLFAVDKDQHKHTLGWVANEEDADFIAGVHGCVADLIRRLHTALDEADRLDIEKDELIGRIADLELEAIDHRGIVTDLEMQISDLQFQLDEVGR